MSLPSQKSGGPEQVGQVELVLEGQVLVELQAEQVEVLCRARRKAQKMTRWSSGYNSNCYTIHHVLQGYTHMLHSNAFSPMCSACQDDESHPNSWLRYES